MEATMTKRRVDSRRFRAYERRDLEQIPQIAALPPDDLVAMRAVSAVLPFRVNEYVLEHLIDWSRVPDDPMFQLTFPQRGMLETDDFARMASLVVRGASKQELQVAARQIQRRMNPHPAGQTTLNVPRFEGAPVEGVQHKYRETVLFFPSQGQTCHAYCSYCFRWPQFVGLDEEKFASREAETLVRYVAAHPGVTSVLFTGGDPLVMRTGVLRRYVEPLLRARLPHLASIRIGTKAPAYWPHRFTTDPDADDLMRLFEEVGEAGLQLALMAHVTVPRELETPEAQRAIRRVRSTGAVVRCQAPIVRHVNDNPLSWAEMWRLQVRLGATPYYMFVQRDTGPRAYFEVPLARAHEVYAEALSRVSGLARTVRGPSMSTTPGKVVLDGVATLGSLRVFVLRFLQARDPRLVGRPFFARYDAKATWFDELTPASAADAQVFRDAADMARSWRHSQVQRRHLPVHLAVAEVA
jgi:KamA family protein